MSQGIDREHLELTDTDLPVADQRDHMGRRHAATVGEAFRQDLPWIIGAIAVAAFTFLALAGWFR
jgi:hypothetical protein